MIKPLSSLLFLLMATTCLMATALDLTGAWTLEVLDLQKRQKVVAEVRFSNKPASSCMPGAWKALVVGSVSKQSEEFFPIKSPLAYTIEDGTLTLGRTQVCDGYLFLSGPEHPHKISGNYHDVSISSSVKLGTFTLQRSK